jgi:uncharacterized protein YwgA
MESLSSMENGVLDMSRAIGKVLKQKDIQNPTLRDFKRKTNLTDSEQFNRR